MVLLSVASIVVVSLAHSTSRNRQIAQTRGAAWAAFTNVADGPSGVSCQNAPQNGAQTFTNLDVSWTDEATTGLRRRQVELLPVYSALAALSRERLLVSTARYCP